MVVVLMKESRKITTTLTYLKGTVRISINTLELLGEPKYIALLINQNERTIAYIPSSKADRAALKVRYANSTLTAGKVVCSVKFVRKVYKLENWDSNFRYQITGKYLESANLVYFRLEDAHQVSNVTSEDDEDDYIDPEYDISLRGE
jgi:hypothetical protein